MIYFLEVPLSFFFYVDIATVSLVSTILSDLYWRKEKESQLVSESILLTLKDNISKSDTTHTHTHTKRKGRWMEGQVSPKGPGEFDRTSHFFPHWRWESRESSDRGEPPSTYPVKVVTDSRVSGREQEPAQKVENAASFTWIVPTVQGTPWVALSLWATDVSRPSSQRGNSGGTVNINKCSVIWNHKKKKIETWIRKILRNPDIIICIV